MCDAIRPMVSVIVPAHNIAAFLPACLDSISAQTFGDFECIVFDDGSGDGTLEVAQAHALLDPRFRTIALSHRGLAAVRNEGIAAARGSWVCFVDGDDVCGPEMLERMVAAAHERDVPMVISDHCLIAEDDLSGSSPVFRDSFGGIGEDVLDELSYWRAFYAGDVLALIYLWNRLVRRDVLEGVRFEAGRLYEDNAVARCLVSRAGRVGLVREPLYCYRQRATSIVNEKRPARYLDLCETLVERGEYFRTRGWDDVWDENALYLLSRVARTRPGVETCDDATRRRYAACRRVACDQARSLLARRWGEPRFLLRAASFLVGERAYLALVGLSARAGRAGCAF